MWFLAFAAGYVLGARADKEEFDDVIVAFKAVRDSEEVRDLASVVRGHAGQALRALADVVEHGVGAAGATDPAGITVVSSDLVERVRRMMTDS